MISCIMLHFNMTFSFSLDYMSQVLFPKRCSYLYIKFCHNFTNTVLSVKISWHLTGK